MKEYLPIELPRSGYEMMHFDPERERDIRRIAEEAKADGRWEQAEAIPIDLQDNVFWAYWLGKTCSPVRKPLKGCEELCGELGQYRKTSFSLDPSHGGKEIIISAVGDLMCTKGLENSADILYGNVEELIFGADISCANLESTFAAGEIAPIELSSGEGPKINLSPAQYNTLTGHKGKRYDLVQLANNHIVDSGEAGAVRTLEQLQKDGIAQAGLNMSAEDADKTTITEKCGLRIGWVSHTFFVNFRPLPEGKPWFVNITPFYIEDEPDLSGIKRQIDFCKRAHCDLVIVSLHWGLEFELYPHPQQRQWAQAIADAGADIILGHHPHVIQFSELLHPADRPAKTVPVIYSLGNLTPIFSSPGTVLSLIARFYTERFNGETSVTRMELYPVALVRTQDALMTRLELVELGELSGCGNAPAQYVSEMADIADTVIGRGWRDREKKSEGGDTT